MREQIALLLRQMDDAWNTLQRALNGLQEEQFWWCPSENAWTLRNTDGVWNLDYDAPVPIPKGPHSVAWLIVHLASCKIMYVEYAFGEGKLSWDDLSLPSSLYDALVYLTTSHQSLRVAVEKLTDENLPQVRKTNWGELWSTEKIIWTMIQHDIYHGGQIQAVRKIFQGQHSS